MLMLNDLRIWPCGAWRWVLSLALWGMVCSCQAPVSFSLLEDDLRLDQAWLHLQRGEFDRAVGLAAEVNEPSFARRVNWDVLAQREGRVVALQRSRADGDPLVIRYLSSPARSRRELAGDELALKLERIRLSSSASRREGLLAAWDGAGGAEAAALVVEAWQSLGDWKAAQGWLDRADLPRTARLRLAAQRQDVALGRLRRARASLLEDLRAGRAVPETLQLLQRVFMVRPDLAAEERLRVALAAGAERGEPGEGSALGVEWTRLSAWLAEERGQLGEAAKQLEGLSRPGAAVRAHAARLVRRVAPADLAAARTDEERLDALARRVDSRELLRLRQLDEWGLAARRLYMAAASGQAGDWPSFAATLDASATRIPGATRLGDLPLRDYGLFGVALDAGAAAARFEGSVLVGGDALGLPPMLAVYDLLEERERQVPTGGAYTEYHVARLRVPSYLGWRGARFAGAGLESFVFLDHDALAEQPLPPGGEPRGELEAWPAVGREQRVALDEPLDVASRVHAAAREAAGEDFFDERLAVLSEHERRHIEDTRAFLAAGLFGKLGSLIGAGLTPGAVREELERRAQLEALRLADDPRIPLAEALSVLPVEGARAASEHARGYATLVAQIVDSLDRGEVIGDEELASLGIRRERVLVQQLHRLSPEAIRSVARSLD